jgi:hypothetical protein
MKKLSIAGTVSVLARAFEDNKAFWLREGKSESEAFELALREAGDIKHDPFSPNGAVLDEEAQESFVEVMNTLA